MLSGCDVAAPDPPSVGPPVHLIGAYPSDGCGVGDDPDCTMPTNAPLTLRFDRFLNPVTATRQALRVYPGDPNVGVPFTYDVVYDPVERVVEYRVPPGAAYKPRTLYRVELLVPEAPGEEGITAFDGAPLAAGALPLEFSFFTSAEPSELPAEPSPPSCATVVREVFGSLGNCATASCHRHGGNGAELQEAPHQLWLEDTGHFAQSALGRVARQTELGDFVGGPATPQGPRFGVRMALIEPKSPGASYLLYKLLLGLDNYEPCSSPDAASVCRDAADPPVSSHPLLPLAEGDALAPSAEELVRLREWFVRGEPMPRGRGGVTLEGLRAVSRFVTAGARCD